MLRLLLAASLMFQGPVRKIAADFPAHGKAGDMELGAEYMAHTVFGESGASIFLPDYVAIQVAVFLPKGKQLAVSQSHFSLKVNGKKPALLAQTAGMVAASLKYADWEQRRSVVATAGAGSGDVILGRPQQTPRFPGDARTRPLPVPRAPEPEDRSGVDRAPVEKPEEVVVREALAEGDVPGFVKGYLYFPYKGKPGSIKKLELMYSGPAGELTLPLI